MTMTQTKSSTYVGFGFGAIQSGLFLYEAYQADLTRRLVVSEVVPAVVSAIRKANGTCHVNIAHPERIERARIENIEIENPAETGDRQRLIEAIAEANEIGTAVPSVDFYVSKDNWGINRILAEGLIKKVKTGGPQAVIYTAENNNHAAEILEKHVFALIPEDIAGQVRSQVQFLNTVIGKMSQVVVDPEMINSQGLACITPDLNRAFLVEAFNRILISRITLNKEFQRGIKVFEEKVNLLPFEEAKLFGHNATHALIGYLGAMLGAKYMAEIPANTHILNLAGEAFMEESGGALIRKYQGSDELFTKTGYQEYVEDLIVRMTNPFLKDAIQRVTRDPERKLGWGDRLIGTMRLALAQGIQPKKFAFGAAAALFVVDNGIFQNDCKVDDLLNSIWAGSTPDPKEKEEIISLIKAALHQLQEWQRAGYPNLDVFLK
jgi:mannitol-1-phosphate/altronate dehydrogenase